jgi:AbrB family looped-hinge helix DNA binding protein
MPRKGNVVRVGRRGQMVLPKAVREALGVTEGDQLWVEVEGNRVILRPVSSLVRESLGSLRGTWGEEIASYLKKEREAWDKGASFPFPPQKDQPRYRPFHLPPGGSGTLFPVHYKTFYRPFPREVFCSRFEPGPYRAFGPAV